MKRRSWDSKTKSKIVLEGLSGKPVSEICSQYQVSQNQYYLWRDKFLAEAHRAFESNDSVGEVARLKAKTQKLQQIIGQLTVELKKTEDELQ
jgi:transposase-like protein